MLSIFYLSLIINNFLIYRAAQQAAALAANTNAGDRKGPPPLLRSRTLPSIIVPGIAILQNQIDSSRLVPGMIVKSFFCCFFELFLNLKDILLRILHKFITHDCII